MKEMTVRQHVSSRILQQGKYALRQSAVKIRQAPSSIFTRKKEHPHALDWKESGKAAVDTRPGVVAAESALFVLSAACIGGAIKNEMRLSREARELNAVVEKTIGTEIRIANSKGAYVENLAIFGMTLGLAGFFGLRLIRMLQAKFEKKGEGAAPAKA